jgi:hypothetical protein
MCVCVCVCVSVCVCLCISSTQINFLHYTAAVNWSEVPTAKYLVCKLCIKKQLFRIENVNLGVTPWKRNGCPTQVYPNRRSVPKCLHCAEKPQTTTQLKETAAGSSTWQFTAESFTIALTQNTVHEHRLIVQLVLRKKGCALRYTATGKASIFMAVQGERICLSVLGSSWCIPPIVDTCVHSNHMKLFLRKQIH